jgi:GntR family transcriptional regulator
VGDALLAASRPPVMLGVVKELYLTVDPDLAPFQQIMDQFRSLIERGELCAGDSLPTVRQLAGDLGVAPNTVARAYAELQEEGLLTCDGRRGTHVAADVPANDRPTRARRLQEAAARFISTLAHRGYSDREIATALRRFMK